MGHIQLLARYRGFFMSTVLSEKPSHMGGQVYRVGDKAYTGFFFLPQKTQDKDT